MQGIFLFKNGKAEEANVRRLFETHGPYLLEDQRLDYLSKVNLVLDSSTKSIQQTGSEISKANTDSVLGRAIVGGILTGGAGAIIGGLSGQRESTINSISSETLNTELTAELLFNDDKSMYVLLKNKEAFYWLLSFTNQPPLTDEEIELEREKAEAEKNEKENYKKFLTLLDVAKEKAIIETPKQWSARTLLFIALITIIISIVMIIFLYDMPLISFIPFFIMSMIFIFPFLAIPILSTFGEVDKIYSNDLLNNTFSNLNNNFDFSSKVEYEQFVKEYNKFFTKR